MRDDVHMRFHTPARNASLAMAGGNEFLTLSAGWRITKKFYFLE
jgi:hypothetical protein